MKLIVDVFEGDMDNLVQFELEEGVAENIIQIL